MTKEPYDKLRADFPLFFTNLLWIECGYGWEWLIRELCGHLVARGTEDDLRFLQIKEKFGSLRIYASGGTPGARRLIGEFEQRSMTTCENCGKEGEVLVSKTGWWKCVCPDCAGDKYKKPG